MKTKYYLPLYSVNLSEYFSRGIILPSCYIDTWSKDIQSVKNNYLLLSHKPIADKNYCSLEIVFSNPNEQEIFPISKNYYLISKPLPISRVKKIFFRSRVDGKNSIYNAEQGDAFIPQELIEITSNNNSIPDIIDYDNELSKNNWKIKNKLFNQVLGGFAVMKLACLDWQDYPNNYFNTFAIINKYVENELSVFEFDNNYFDYLKIKNDKAQSVVFDKVTYETAIEYAKSKDNFDLIVKRGHIRIDEINPNKNSYILSILATYGSDSGKIKKIDDFISSIVNNRFNQNKLEKICLLFGINQGYSAFRNYYYLSNKKLNVKLKLNSILDYSIIESIYQYVYNSKTNNFNFPYIESWCSKNVESRITNDYETYKLFDKEIIFKKKAKIGSAEYIRGLFQGLKKIDLSTKLSDILAQVVNKVRNDFELQNKIMSIEKHNLQEQIKKQNNEIEQLKLEVENISNNKKVIKSISTEHEQGELNLINNKKYELLNKMKSIADLKAIAKYLEIPSSQIQKFTKSDDDKQELRDLILKKENES
jgi:hypothetical protein